MTTVSDIGERALIARIKERVPQLPEWVAVGIGDDAAVLEPERNALQVVTTDALVEGVHFDRGFMPPAAIGHRALAANFSDVAAMGARPRAALLSLALPDALPLVDFDEMIAALLALAATSRVPLVGGNIARSPGPLVVDITVLGTAQRRRLLRRDGARPGDVVFVSGEVGAASAGLAWCRARGFDACRAVTPSERGEVERLAARFLYPEARLRLGWLLARNRAATACMDLSDGLADAVQQVARASGVGAKIRAGDIPVPAAAAPWLEREGRDTVTAAITGGEDYELLFTVPGRRRRLIDALRRGLSGVPLTAIGVITRGPEVVLTREGRPDEAMPQGYSHFR
ncbi:MAG: thiamine-phosphate kinase [Bacteroidales bacterium]